MDELTQRERLLREEQLLIANIDDLQQEIDGYNEDLKKLRKHLADLDNGVNNNTWRSYCDALGVERG